MHITRLGTPKDASVGSVTATKISDESPSKRWTMIHALTANTQYVYVGNSELTAANGFGELVGTDASNNARGDSITIPGSAAVYCIAASGTQHVRVLEGFK